MSEREPKRHNWSRDGETCLDCGDKDWMAGAVCQSLPQRQKDEYEHYWPTCELRWNTVEVNPNGPTAAIPWTGEPQYARVLEQRWKRHGHPDKWRFIPSYFNAPHDEKP
jgi:hypothetical protein